MEKQDTVESAAMKDFDEFISGICNDEDVKKALYLYKDEMGRLKKITEKYLSLMAECVKMECLRIAFEHDPRLVLSFFVEEMIIPEDAIIKLDPNSIHWPVLYLRDKKTNHTYKYAEYSDSVEMTIVDEPGTRVQRIQDFRYINKDAKAEVISQGERVQCLGNFDCNMKITVPLPEDCEKIIVLPYFTFLTDMITTFTFNGDEKGNETIVLSSCS